MCLITDDHMFLIPVVVPGRPPTCLQDCWDQPPCLQDQWQGCPRAGVEVRDPQMSYFITINTISIILSHLSLSLCAGSHYFIHKDGFRQLTSSL